jgi:prevent-host-death family protein
MGNVGVREARRDFSRLLDRAASGEEIVIVKRGRGVARIVALDQKAKRLPSLKSFREALTLKGRSLSQEVVAQREEERA